MDNNRLQRLVRTSLLLALALAVQTARLPQTVTGPMINAILLLAVSLGGGLLSGIVVGSITPWVAVIVGIAAFPPVAPVIMGGNIALVVVFAALSRILTGTWGELAAAVSGAIAKYLVMFSGIRYLVAPNLPLPPPAIIALTITQLYTALLGGLLSVAVMKTLRDVENLRG